MKGFMCGMVTLIFLILFPVGLNNYNQYVSEISKPRLVFDSADMSGLTVAVASDTAQNGLVGWRFNLEDESDISKVDQFIEGRKGVVYVHVLSTAKTGHVLRGVVEVDYLQMNNHYVPVAVNNISAVVTEPVNKCSCKDCKCADTKKCTCQPGKCKCPNCPGLSK